MTVNGIDYELPKVLLLQESGIGVAEIAARTCYDSFENSENPTVRQLSNTVMRTVTDEANKERIDFVNEIESSDLLDSLAWVHHHHSIIEHTTLSFLVKGTSRGVLQEHARHRIQAISVRSTRYTMAGVINAFVASLVSYDISPPTSKGFFERKLRALDMFVVSGPYVKLETDAIHDKMMFQYKSLGHDEFIKTAVAKSSIDFLKKGYTAEELFEALQSGKKKRNVGDAFKHVVSDNWKVDMVVSFNLRSLKNYFDLRDSGAAYFQIQWLAEAMKEVTPDKYLKLIVKGLK